MRKIEAFDTTLRDGAQSEKISFSVADKLKIVKLLDALGVDVIEAGNPTSNVKDVEFFKEVVKLELKSSRLAAFGSTRRVNALPGEDENLRMLTTAGTDIVVIFGKAWDLHVSQVLNTTNAENVAMITDSIRLLKKHGKIVYFDAEHYFDGYKNNPAYAREVLLAAKAVGADRIILCDTNGGTFPHEIERITRDAINLAGDIVGIHAHNDCGLAVANSMAAARVGAVQIQGTLNGVGERCGNANLSTIIANLQLKGDREMIPPGNLPVLTQIARTVSEISNISISGIPYVSKSAFTHKAGMHIDAVLKNPQTFEHIDPAMIGNARSTVVSEIAGKSAILGMMRKVMPHADKHSPEIPPVLEKLKELEYAGYQYEAAEASFELVVRRTLGLYKPFFEILQLKLIIEQDKINNCSLSSALIKVLVGETEEITAADSDGPVHAMDLALRKALEVFYPALRDVHLTDYKVRVLDSEQATGAKVRVLIESTDGKDSWMTVGVSTDVIEASKKALIDSIEYKLIKDEERQ